MKTRHNHFASWSLLGLCTLALTLFATAGNAEAAVRVSATVRTPYGVVRVDNGGTRTRCEMLPVRHLVAFRIADGDRQMARRLAWYTGVSKHEILDLRRQGYRWDEIGRWLGVHRSVVRAAESRYSWERFVDRDGRYDRCDMGDNHRDHDRRHQDNRGRGKGRKLGH